MSLTFSVPARYSYVLLAGLGANWLTVWQAYAVVAKHRALAKIPYPQAYAESALAEKNPAVMKFNCAQRAHQNTLEVLPHVLFTMAVAGLKYPTLTAGLGAAWIFFRVVFTLGYTTGDVKKRNYGRPHGFAALGLMLTASWSIGEMILATL